MKHDFTTKYWALNTPVYKTMQLTQTGKNKKVAVIGVNLSSILLHETKGTSISYLLILSHILLYMNMQAV